MSVLEGLIPVDLDELGRKFREQYPLERGNPCHPDCDLCDPIKIRNKKLLVTSSVLLTAQVIPMGGQYYIDPDRYVIVSRYRQPKADLVQHRPPGWEEDRVLAMRWLRERGVSIDNYSENYTSAGGLTEEFHLHGHVLCNRGDGRETGTGFERKGFGSIRYAELAERAVLLTAD